MMDRLEKIQRISAALRYLLITASVVLGGAVILGLFSAGQDWVSVGDGRFTEFWRNNTGSRTMLIAVTAPIAVILVLGVYWLQRLFGEYQAGRFFTDSSMRCYVWLVWLKAFSFLYGAVWPPLLVRAAGAGAADSLVSLDAGTFVELVVLLLIVHVLKEAQQLSDENKSFV